MAGELVYGDLSSGMGDGVEWQQGDTRIRLQGAIALGSVIRADQSEDTLTSSRYGMDTINDGNLNYDRGDAVSTALETYLQADISHRNVGFLVSVKGWYDYAQKHQGVNHGSVTNGYQPSDPLSDAGFVKQAKFSNAIVNDAYVYGNFTLAERDLTVRLGNQAIPWVTPTTIAGGLQKVNAFDYASIRRASSIAEARTVAMPSLYAKLSLTDNLSVDAFTQFKFRPDVFAGCGTFLSTSDYAQPGCDKLTLNGSVLSALSQASVKTSDAQAIGNALDHVKRGPDDEPDNNQYGIGFEYLLDNVGLFGLYYAKYTSRNAYTQVVRTGPGVLTPAAANLGLAQPTGIAAYYQRRFPTELEMYALNFKTRLPDGTGIYAEYSLRPNQPIAWNGSDFVTGLLAGTGPLGYLANTPTGFVAQGYDNFRVSQFNLGVSRPLGNLLGGNTTLSGEIGMKYVHDLPDTEAMRYGRAGFGTASHSNSPTCTGPEIRCQVDGFITPFSWGTRLKLETQYQNILPDLDLTPSLALGYDIKGYSYDGVFSEGRYGAIFSAKAEYKNDFYFNLSYQHTGGGDYNIVSDRSMFQATAGFRF